MALFEWSREIKDEIKAAVSASIETKTEMARLQERVLRAEAAFEKALGHFETVVSKQAEQLQTLRDRVASLEAQQSALHNNAKVLAAYYGDNKFPLSFERLPSPTRNASPDSDA